MSACCKKFDDNKYYITNQISNYDVSKKECGGPLLVESLCAKLTV